MAILAFQKPDKVIMVEADDTHGKFEFRPLEPGYGITVGNALRRILLSSLEGYAITTTKIEGIDHEFSTVKGVIQDVTEIILNLKQIRFKKQIEDIENEKILVSITGQNEFKAGDLSKFLNSFEILNPDHIICQMENDVKLQMEISISKGRGYVTSEENRPVDEEFGLISLDSIFTPIKNVRYSVENYRVEQKTDYEKLIIEIQTDGSIHPKDALKEAAKILIYHFMLFSDEKITLDTDEKFAGEEFDEEILHMRQLLKTKLVDLDLSVRALNCLKAAEVETLGDLVKFNKNDLLKFRNFGKKSLTELDDKLKSMNLTFGMDTAKFKLDTE
jgi:DNA-directed RNA polymerase subunit alpha